MHWHGPRVTPFSRIDLEDQPSFDECLETMEVELEQAVLVIRGSTKARTSSSRSAPCGPRGR